MSAPTNSTTAPVSTDTAVIRALRRIRVPQTQRNRELGLLVFAFVLNHRLDVPHLLRGPHRARDRAAHPAAAARP